MKTHKDLDVYQYSIVLVTELFNVTKNFSKEELFGLTSQIRRSAILVLSNIAEGSARNHSKEFKQFLYIALSSASELDTQLLIALNIEFITNEDYSMLVNKLTFVSKMLQGLIKSLNA